MELKNNSNHLMNFGIMNGVLVYIESGKSRKFTQAEIDKLGRYIETYLDSGELSLIASKKTPQHAEVVIPTEENTSTDAPKVNVRGRPRKRL